MSHSLDQLRATGTTIVCDSGDFAAIAKYGAQDATTNPTLILAASTKAEYSETLAIAVEYGRNHGDDLDDQIDKALDRLLVEFGRRILEVVPGRVSTEVDACLSFDTDATVKKARHIIELYQSVGVSKERVLIKIASTWEGIQAARILQREHNINCNLTLLFSRLQASTAAEAGAFLISPFVARVLDWYKANAPEDLKNGPHPGVRLVRDIFYYYKKFASDTIVMAASFRSLEEVTELAGCDYMTAPPSVLEELQLSNTEITRKLKDVDASALQIEQKSYIDNEAAFRFDFNEDAMAAEKLREGISKFASDAETLKSMLRVMLQGNI